MTCYVKCKVYIWWQKNCGSGTTMTKHVKCHTQTSYNLHGGKREEEGAVGVQAVRDPVSTDGSTTDATDSESEVIGMYTSWKLQVRRKLLIH